MAYSALVRCAGASGLNIDTVPEETLGLAWYCIKLILDSIGVEDLQDRESTEKEKQKARQLDLDGVDLGKEQLHRLHLTLISTVPSLPLVLMHRTLELIKTIVISTPLPTHAPPSSDTQGRRDELVRALFDEIVERIGYREKGAAMKWWYENRMALQSSPGASTSEEKNEDREASLASVSTVTLSTPSS